MSQLFFHPIISTLRYLQLPIAIAIFIYAALFPSSQNNDLNLSATVLHLIGNILLILSAWTAMTSKVSLNKIFVGAAFFSLAIELSQSFTQTRVTDVFDIAVNFIGLGCGYLLCLLGEKIVLPRQAPVR